MPDKDEDRVIRPGGIFTPPPRRTGSQVDVAVSAGGTGTIRLNGQDVSNTVAGLTINTHVGEMTTVLLRVPVTKVRFDGEARVILQDELVALLVAAGWTPPDE